MRKCSASYGFFLIFASFDFISYPILAPFLPVAAGRNEKTGMADGLYLRFQPLTCFGNGSGRNPCFAGAGEGRQLGRLCQLRLHCTQVGATERRRAL